MATGDRIAPVNDTEVVQPVAPPPLRLESSSLRRATEFLIDSSRLGPLRTHYDKYRRYVILESQSIYDALVSLYAGIFTTQWQHYRRFMDTFTPPQNVTPQVYAARTYISSWFIDLYVSNREAVKKISSIAFNERYSGELLRFSPEYDSYLALLNASIRPTHVKLALEDALYLPILSEVVEVNNANPFGINNFSINEELFYGFLQIMKERKCWNMTTLSNDTMGRPCWLFDWHNDNRVCAWFHMEGNFNNEDVTLAYIIGVPCTPKLAPRDVDDWQFFPNGIVPQVIIPTNYQRVVPRRFYGSYEVRQIEVDPDFILLTGAGTQIVPATPGRGRGRGRGGRGAAAQTSTQSIGAEPSEAQAGQAQAEEQVQAMPRYRVVDWTYYYLVVLNIESHTRTGALRIISLA